MLSAIKRSVRAKVVVVILAATLSALLVSAVALLTYETRSYRNFLIGDITTQADVLARMSAPALALNDPKEARRDLEVLDNRADILSAALYTVEGDIVASYSRRGEDAKLPHAPEAGPPQVEDNVLSVVRPVLEESNVLGFLYLRARYDVAGRARDYAVILGGVLLASLLAAALVSVPLQNNVTRPVLAIADVARRVISEREFTRRAPKTSEDEIGVLVEAFNGMLAEVSARQQALEESNRKLLEETEERRNAEAALRLADRRKDEFLATLAHELRNPLAPLVNAISLLSSPKIDAATRLRVHEIMDRQITHMVRLVEDLLDVSRITRDKLDLRMDRVSLATIVQHAIDTVRPQIDERHQSLNVELPAELVELDADSVRLSQVFSNLLNNANKYTADGGNISLTVSCDGNTARVVIADDGMGIETTELTRIFDMFAQTQGPAQRVQFGLGVGLALAKRLVELHGGTIEAASDGLGRGSRFTVSLPVVAAMESRGAAAAPELEKVAERRRILLVEDNEDFAATLKLLLESLGHVVRVAHDGPQALETAQEFDPEFAFVDIGLPSVSGYALAERLRELSEKIVLIALSGWNQRQEERPALDEFAMHLVKPVGVDGIRAALEALASAGSTDA